MSQKFCNILACTSLRLVYHKTEAVRAVEGTCCGYWYCGSWSLIHCALIHSVGVI